MTRVRRFIPTLDALECRLAPANLVDLTTDGADGEIGDALVVQTDYGPTGTGVMNTFVRVQAKKKDHGVEHGYNTDARHLQFDEKKGSHTRSLTLGEVPQVEIDGVVYREFLLDINEPGGGRRKLSLDELRLYAGDAPDLDDYDEDTKELNGLTAFYDMDALEDNYVLLNAKLSHGSGSGDMFLYVPESTFTDAGASAGSYLYLYSKFGDTVKAQGGFEEWGHRDLPPLPPTGSLSGLVYEDVNGNSEFDAGDVGIVGVTLVLTNSSGAVVGTTVTVDGGLYSFTALAAGTYTITEQQPPVLFDGADNVGTVNGEPRGTNVGNDALEIVLGAHEHGIDYNFGEVRDMGG